MVGPIRVGVVLLGIAAAVLGACATTPAEERTPTVSVDSGTLEGIVLSSGVKAWLGIPYVEPPVRERRWRAPEPIRWEGTYHADRKMPECPQVLRPHDINHYFGEEATSEDCLYMNVWAPAGATADSALPVIVFLYGGGMTVGSSGMALYDGAEVARRGAVFVNFNYRLGLLGLMAHPALTAESGHNASGNWAYLDMVAALQWIQRNIGRFGGDPGKVVITGQSAGAGAVSLLQASPLAKGLFRAVVAMSGGTWRDGGRGGVPLDEAEQTGLQVQGLLSAASIAELRNVPSDRLLALQTENQLMAGGGGPVRVSTSVDRYFLPDTPAALFASGQASDVPVIAGFANDESGHALRKASSAAEYRAIAQEVFGTGAGEFLELYPVADDDAVAETAKTAAREGGVMRTARNWAKAQAASMQSPVFIYNLSRVHPFNPQELTLDRVDLVGAYHTSDVPYWFGTLEAFNLFRRTRLWTDADRDVSQKMTAALIALANSGSPSTADLQWPAWSTSDEALLEIGTAGQSVEHMHTDRLDFMAHAGSGPTVESRVPAGIPRD